MDPRVIELLQVGLSAPEALDYLAVVEDGYTQTDWAQDVCGKSQQAVSKNVRQAKRKLAERN